MTLTDEGGENCQYTHGHRVFFVSIMTFVNVQVSHLFTWEATLITCTVSTEGFIWFGGGFFVAFSSVLRAPGRTKRFYIFDRTKSLQIRYTYIITNK